MILRDLTDFNIPWTGATLFSLNVLEQELRSEELSVKSLERVCHVYRNNRCLLITTIDDSKESSSKHSLSRDTHLHGHYSMLSLLSCIYAVVYT